jgi:uncharacterized protein (TIGR02453 family)
MSDEFEGFGPETFAFLRDLTLNNERAWFTANRERYETFYLAPALAFIEAIGPRLEAALPGGVKYEPRVSGSLFRINRDVRFSKDKTPYKSHIDMWFWTGEKKGWDTPAYFMRLLPDSCAIGGGMHHLGKEALGAYRRAVVDEMPGAALEAAVTKVPAAYEVGQATRKTVPRGYDAAHPRARYLPHEGLVAVLEEALPPEVESAAFVDACVAHFQAVSPINEWLASCVTR